MTRHLIRCLIAVLLVTGSASAQWIQVSCQGYNVRTIVPTGSGLYVNSPSGVSRSTDHGVTFDVLLPGAGLVSGSTSTVFASVPGLGLVRTDDGGGLWRYCGLPVLPGSVAAEGQVMMAAHLGVFRTTDGGERWEKTLVTKNGTYYPPVYCIAMRGSTVLAGTGFGTYRSSDTGVTWVLTNAGGSRPTTYAYVLLDTVFFAGTYAGVWRSTDDGATWTSVSEGLPRPTTIGIFSLCSSPGYLYAAADAEGVFVSRSDTINWRTMSHGMPSGMAFAIAADEQYAYAGIGSGGLWRRPISELTSVEVWSRVLPQGYELQQNYPNPFNPFTTIRYGLPHRSAVQLTVYNTLGQEVAQLVNGDMEAGYHEITFDASGFSSGVYLYWMKAGSYLATKKLLVVK